MHAVDFTRESSVPDTRRVRFAPLVATECGRFSGTVPVLWYGVHGDQCSRLEGRAEARPSRRLGCRAGAYADARVYPASLTAFASASTLILSAS